MKLRLTIANGDSPADVTVTADTTTTVGDLIARLDHQLLAGAGRVVPAASLSVNPGTASERLVPGTATLGEAGLRSGDVIAVSSDDRRVDSVSPPAGGLYVVEGPDAGKRFELRRGTNVVGRGRDCDVRLTDPLVSKRHAKVNVSDSAEVIDDGSANGVLIGDATVDRVVLRPGTAVTLGDTTFTVTVQATTAAEDGDGAIDFNRSPRLDPRYQGVELTAPQPPKPVQAQRFPIVMLAAPIMMAGMIYAVTQNATAILFVALSPLMMIGNWFENRTAIKKALETATANFRSALVDLSVQLQYAADLERAGRRHEHPSAGELEQAVRDLSPLTWTRRPEHDAFLEFRLGLGTQPSRNTVEMPSTNDTVPELWRELQDVVSRFGLIDRVPVVADLRSCGNVGIAGPARESSELAANLVGQIAALHSPAELVIAGVAGESAPSWDWLKWLPHVGSEFSPLDCPPLASNGNEANVLVAALEEEIGNRTGDDSQADGDALSLPIIVLFVSDDAPLDRARLVQIAERGPAVGVHVIWHSPSLETLPAACRVFIETDGMGRSRAGFVEGGADVADLEPDRVSLDSAMSLARRLAPVQDSGVRADDQSDLPRTVSFLGLTGLELGESPPSVIESWHANNAMPPDPSAPRRKRDNSLRALVGQGAGGPLHLDLRTQGPHALVGGTTGAGKSEFLQSWVLGMATMHSPSRVTFLFVDYKGGAAFAECVDLPHCVGLVTDLSPHLVRRALTSLNAELHHRELILNSKKAKDLLELERRNDPEAPPSLVIIVDEFAALVTEVPEFVDGVVNVAQRGRSLGLHLILATQRPAGVIRDNLRANTNLRVALRMADEEDSTDVVGTTLAASFDPFLPGRAVAKTGPGRLTTFQSAYVGGHTSNEPPKPDIHIRDLRFGTGREWDEPDEQVVASDDGPSDIKRIVANVTLAATEARISPPRKPWLPELSATYRLEDLPTRRTDTALVFGVRDDPKRQSQPELGFNPDDDGNMAVYGTGGSGKSTFLRSIAFAASLSTARGGPTHVYALDFGSRGLQMLEVLPHVGAVITGEDSERIERLLRTLKVIADDRAERFATANASTIVEYRARADRPDEPRILVLVDGVGSFRSAYEATSASRYWDLFQGLVADGRALGIHFVMSADRPGAVSSSLASAIQRRLVLRLSNEMDYVMVDAPSDGFSQTSPPGRGFLNGDEVQVAVFGGDSNVAVQAERLARHAESMRRAGIGEAPGIASLPELVSASELPSEVDGQPTIGVWDETLQPIGFALSGTFLVSGPPISGRTTTVATMASAIARARPGAELVYLGQKRSPLENAAPWSTIAQGSEDIAKIASELAFEAGDREPGSLVVVVENVGDLLNTECDGALQDLFRACRASDQFVIAEGETSTVTGSWPLLQAVKASRAGIVLQPDQMDGESLFKTPFPRVARADFPPGRGLLVGGGATKRVQVALPD